MTHNPFLYGVQGLREQRVMRRLSSGSVSSSQPEQWVVWSVLDWVAVSSLEEESQLGPQTSIVQTLLIKSKSWVASSSTLTQGVSTSNVMPNISG